MKKLIVLMTWLFLSVFNSPANANVMAIWDFGPDATGYTLNPTTEHVVGTPTLVAANADYDTNGKNGIAYRDADGIFHHAGQAVAWDDVSGAGTNDAYWIVSINTTGWQDMAIRWDYFSDGSGNDQGPTSFDLDYKVGGGGWITILNNQPITRDDTWWEFSYDLSSITAIENQPYVWFRVMDLNRADDNGDYKFDNLEFTGVPEPATVFLLGIGSLVLLRKRRP